MANTINGTATGQGGLITTGDNTDELQLQTGETARVTLTNTAVVVNEDGNDVDFRVEGDTDANLLFVDAGNDRVGIGTSTPEYKVNISNANASTGLTANPLLVLTNTQYTVGTGASLGFIFNSSSTIGAAITGRSLESSAGGYLTFETRNASGTMGERVRIDADGIKFNGDTAAANALDDYEEGTWTGTITDLTNDATMNGATGSYVKIGSLVTAFGYFSMASKGSISGSLRFKGLPFTSSSGNNNYSGQAFGYTETANITAGQSIGGYVQVNANYIILTKWDATGGTTQLQATEINNGFNFIVTFTYRTDS